MSSSEEEAVRRELCDEAIRLASILAEHESGQTPETFALLALTHLHAARLAARQDELGALLLLEEQDRQLWSQAGIQEGLRWLALSARGDNFSRYHAEAAIAAEHCRANSFQETRWNEIAECYALLEQTTQSPIHRLNRAVAVISDLHRRCGNAEAAKRYREVACDSVPNTQLRKLLQRRLQNTGSA